jgi:uncharacterized membrane protein YidH (DUF202 family)
MLEKIMNSKDFRKLLYVFGIAFEIIGFALLFAFNKTIVLIHQYKILYSIILIVGGYLLAVKQR